jgi:hypothetical protein
MAGDFNPYHVWLSIQPEEQPPNHYRLLGLPLFETNADVIDSAADRQMAHLRTFQSGKHGDLTQRLLNEVAAARVCLLDAKKRAAYDQQLRVKLPAATPAAQSTAQPATQPAKAPVPLQRAVATPAADKWDDLLGNPVARPAQKAGGKPANPLAAPSAKQAVKSRLVSIGIAVGVVLIAGISFGVYSWLTGKTDGTLVFDWPDRTDVVLTVDNAPIEVAATGAWERNYPAGPHRVAAERPAFKFASDINLTAGQRLSVSPDWKPKAVLVLNWSPGQRSGAVLKIDGRVQSISQHDPMEVPVEPGRHTIQITRPGFDPIVTLAVVAADGRELVSIAAPPTTAKLVFDWPAAERKDAELIVDGSSRAIADGSDSERLALTLKPGRHVVHVTRRGFEPFNQAVDLSAGTDSEIKPTWAPERIIVAVPTVNETPVPVEVAPQPAKKPPIPPAAEQEKIAKQLNDLYKTSQPGPKGPAKAQELYDVAAKDGSSPAERYMLLMKGAEIAAAAGDLNLSLQGIDTLDADYDIDVLEAKQKLLDKFIAAGKPDQVAIAIQTAEQLVDQAVAADRFGIAVVLATSASKAVAKSKIPTHKEVEERLSRRRHDIHVLEPLYTAAKKAQETLGKTPADPEANLTVGRWLCFYKGDWTTGLPLLAKGGDEKLKSLAQQELKAPTDAEQQAHLGDAWWEVAQKEAGTARDSLHRHAGDIYQTASLNLTSALRKAAIEKRLAEIANLPHPFVAAATIKPSAQTLPSGPSTVPAATADVTQFPRGQWVDVLRLVDIARDRVSGNWHRDANELKCEVGQGNRIELPVAVDGDYDLEIEFTRTKGDSDVVTMFPIRGHSCMATLSGFSGKASGLMNLAGHDASDPNNPTSVRPGDLDNGHRYRLSISVRIVANDRASVDVSLDGKQYLPHWEGDPADISEHWFWEMPNPTCLGLGSGSEVTFHSARLRIVRGQANSAATSTQMASPTASADKPSQPVEFPRGTWVDVLRLVDTARDRVNGMWRWNGNELFCKSVPFSRIELPVDIDGSYDLEVEFTRSAGNGDVATVLSIGSHRVVATVSAWGGQFSGLSDVGGHSINDTANPSTVRPGSLENDRRYRLTISVRILAEDRASIDVSLDGKAYLPHWEGDPAALSIISLWGLPNPSRLGLGTYASKVTFHSARLRMVSGHALADASASSTSTPEKPIRTEFGSGDGQSQWMKEVARLPADQQVDAVLKKLQQSNSDYDGTEEHKIEGGIVTEFKLATDNVTDISPLRAFTGLKELKCAGSSPGKGSLYDLSPLKGMVLKSLDFGWTKVSDLSPLQGMPLVNLQFGSTRVSDLSPLKNMPLTFLDCGGTQVTELSPLKGAPLNRLICDRSRVSDLSPLKGSPLRNLNCSQDQQLSDLSPLKGMNLTELFCNDTKVSDLSPLKGMPLRCLYFDKTHVYDVSSLAGSALNEVAFTPQQIRVGLDVLRRMPSIRTLRRNAWDAATTPAEFWRKYDAGELNK